MKTKVHYAFTDGSIAYQKGRVGGWAYCITLDPKDRKFLHACFGGESDTTGNRMELTAAIRVLEYASNNSQIENLIIYSDSQYVVDTLHFDWISVWESKGWISSAGTDVKNVDLWKRAKELTILLRSRNVSLKFAWVKGHSGNYFNELADRLAKEGRYSEVKNRIDNKRANEVSNN